MKSGKAKMANKGHWARAGKKKKKKEEEEEEEEEEIHTYADHHWSLGASGIVLE